MATLQELITTGRMKVGDYVDYHPEVKEYTAMPEQTGWDREQVLTTDTTAQYVFWGIDPYTGNVQLATTKSVNPITFSGARSFLGAAKELHTLAKTNYSCKALGAIARSFTVEDYNRKYGYQATQHPARKAYFIEEPGVKEISFHGNSYETCVARGKKAFYHWDGGGVLKKDKDGVEYRTPNKKRPVFVTESYYYYDFNRENFEGECWLASPCVGVCSNAAYFGMRYARSSLVNASYLYISCEHTNYFTYGVRPLISLSSELPMDEHSGDGSTPEKAWRFADEEKSLLSAASSHEEKEVTREVKPFSKWRHFKGMTAMVITVAQHSETGEKLVVYYCMGNQGKTNHKDGIYARPLEMFLSEVDHEKYPNVTQKYRFEEITENN